MKPTPDNPVPYHATATRPSLSELPQAVHDEITWQLGARIQHVTPAGGGFTGGFAATVTSTTGESMFVKAAGPKTPFVVDAYGREAHINMALPGTVPAPRLHFSSQVGDWVCLGFQTIKGQATRLPMSTAQVDAMLRAWAQASEALNPLPRSLRDLGVPRFVADPEFQQLGQAAAGVTPVPEMNGFEHRLDEMAALESLLDAAITGDEFMHGDLRPDNIMLDGQRAWICDWSFVCRGVRWFDTVALLIVAQGDGHDADRLFWRHPTSRGVTGEQLDSVLAASIGYYLCNSMKPDVPLVSAYLRPHQRWNGLAGLSWLVSRRGW